MSVKEYMLAKDYIRFSGKEITAEEVTKLFSFTSEEASFLLKAIRKEKIPSE